MSIEPIQTAEEVKLQKKFQSTLKKKNNRNKTSKYDILITR